MRTATSIFAIYVTVLTAMPCSAETTIEYPFSIIEMEKPDERALASHRHKAINLQCEYVAFDSASLLRLIQKIESEEIQVSETSVSIRLLDGQWLTLRGLSSEVGSTANRDGPFVWEGKAEDGSESAAMFVIQSADRTTAYISRSGVVFRLAPSIRSRNYLLCQRDPEFRGKKID